MNKNIPETRVNYLKLYCLEMDLQPSKCNLAVMLANKMVIIMNVHSFLKI